MSLCSPPHFKPADRLRSIGVSEILAITSRAAEFKLCGKDVVSLSIGEPDFDTPDWIKEAATKAIWEGDTKYTGLDGSPALKLAIQEKFERENDVVFPLSHITVSAGAKQVIYNAMMASLNCGDEVVLSAPYWTSYADIVTLAGGRVTVARADASNGFHLTSESLSSSITERTRWVFFNSPSNPSGATYSPEMYQPLLDVLRRHPQVWLLVDDIYEHIVFDGLKLATPATLAPDLADRILTVNGVSKAYAMTGWRIGYGAGPEALVKAMAVVQSQATSCPSSVSQRAAIAALSGPQEIVRKRRDEFERRRNVVVERLNAISGISCRKPEGSFYAFPDCSELIGRTMPSGKRIGTDIELSRYLLEDALVAVVPGSTFEYPGHIRISYATSLENIEEACRRIARASALLGRRF